MSQLPCHSCGTAVVAPVGGVLLCGQCAQLRAKTWRAFFVALEGLRERSSASRIATAVRHAKAYAHMLRIGARQIARALLTRVRTCADAETVALWHVVDSLIRDVSALYRGPLRHAGLEKAWQRSVQCSSARTLKKLHNLGRTWQRQSRLRGALQLS